jgi:plasmid stabilization system protein ParE
LTPIRLHERVRRERLDAKRRYGRRDPASALRFDDALRKLFVRIKEAPNQFPEHALLALPTEAGPLFFAVRRALLSKPFPYVVFFYVRQGTAVVLAIAHARRRLGYWSARR